MNVFVSVGSSSKPAHEAFVRAVEDRLRAEGLTPLTVGRNYFTADSLFIGVNKLMDECRGVVVIALERLHVDSATEKRGSAAEKRLQDLKLATPWNQIEAALAGQRDLGVAALAHQRPAATSTRLLGGPVVLAARFERWVGLAWIGGLAMLALVFGIVAQSAARGNVGVQQMEQAVARLGGHQGGAAAWLGYEFVFIAALAAFAAVGQISALRSEEADGHLDNLLARPVSRATWLAARLGFAAVLVVLTGLATGVGGWIGVVAARGNGVGLAAMLQAGLNVAVPALFVIGVGTLLYGLAPRLTVPVLYALILWSFLIQIIGSTITINHWLLDTAVLTHLGPVPATSPNWTAVAWLTGLGVLAALAGLATFNRRDLVAA